MFTLAMTLENTYALAGATVKVAMLPIFERIL